MRADAITEGGIYVDVTLTAWRRVIAVTPGPSSVVVYSVGTDVNRSCLLLTFRRWAKKRISVDADGLIEEVADERSEV